MLADKLDERLDARLPPDTAETLSTTWIETRSFTLRERTSLARSPSVDDETHSEPGDSGLIVSVLCSASWIYLSSAEAGGWDGCFFFLSLSSAASRRLDKRTSVIRSFMAWPRRREMQCE